MNLESMTVNMDPKRYYWELWVKYMMFLQITRHMVSTELGHFLIFVEGPDGSYHFFVGVDGSRAYVKGDFKNGLTTDVDDFTPEDAAGLQRKLLLVI
jgi:hypothetical protein